METSTHRVSTQYILAKTKRSKTKHAFLTPVHLFNCCHSSKPSANPHSSAAYSALPSQEHLPFLSPNTVLSMYCPAFPTPCPCVFAFLLQLLGSSLGTWFCPCFSDTVYAYKCAANTFDSKDAISTLGWRFYFIMITLMFVLFYVSPQETIGGRNTRASLLIVTIS